MAEELSASDERADGVTTWMTFIGGGEPRYILNFAVEQPNPAYAFLLINTILLPDAVLEMIPRVEAFCREKLPGHGGDRAAVRHGSPPSRNRSRCGCRGSDPTASSRSSTR